MAGSNINTELGKNKLKNTLETGYQPSNPILMKVEKIDNTVNGKTERLGPPLTNQIPFLIILLSTNQKKTGHLQSTPFLVITFSQLIGLAQPCSHATYSSIFTICLLHFGKSLLSN